MLAMNLTPGPAPKPVVETAPQIKTTEVLVAAKPIQIGTKIDAGLVTWRPWPQDNLISTYITRAAHPNAPAELASTIARGSFFEGEPITEAKVAHTDSGFVSAILPSGMRAVAIPVSASTSAGGFILPNDRVDVIMTRKLNAAGSNGQNEERIIPETILTNVKVLGIDQSVNKSADNQQAVVGQTATLELTQEQAEIITVAQRMNDKLTLALRSLADANAGSGVPSSSSQRSGVIVVRRGVSQEVDTNR
jgi:pilus assembly protein CpaB